MAKKVYKTTKKYPCPFCEKRLPRTELVTHVQNTHEELIPEDYSASRVVYDKINKTDHGTCMVCKRPVYEWDEKTCRYKNLCFDNKCKEQVRKIALERHIRVYNKPTLLNDGEHQEKMLANRKISGKYKHSDGTMFTYTGQYERAAIEFMDTVLNIGSKDIQMPGPILEYEFNGETHKWVTDIYYIPANLIIEVKDGGKNPNKRDMPEYRAKQLAKETMITELGKFNYLRLTDNNFVQLLVALANIKYENLDQSEANNAQFFINESTSLFDEEVGGLPRHSASTVISSLWIEPCMMNNKFNIAIRSDDSDDVILHGSDEELVSLTDEEFKEQCTTNGTMYIRKDPNCDFKRALKASTFREAFNIAIGCNINILDELALHPEWKYLDKTSLIKEQRFIENGIKRLFDVKMHPNHYNEGNPIAESVVLSNSINGYFIHTPDDYYLASKFYKTPSEIPRSLIESMSRFYQEHLRRKQDGYFG